MHSALTGDVLLGGFLLTAEEWRDEELRDALLTAFADPAEQPTAAPTELPDRHAA